MQVLPKQSAHGKIVEGVSQTIEDLQFRMEALRAPTLFVIASAGAIAGLKLLEVDSRSHLVNFVAKTAGTSAMVGFGLVTEHLLHTAYVGTGAR